jgi:chromosome segregation ATPase
MGFSLKLRDTLTFLANLQAGAMSQKTEQAEKEAAELRLKLQSTEKDLQGSQHELELTKHALERANFSLSAARLEQQRLQTHYRRSCGARAASD